MKITNLEIQIINVVEQTTYIKNVKIETMNENLIDIFQKTNEVNPNISFNSYYIFDFELFLNEHKLPYIIRNDRIEWNVDINTVTLFEFMNTHKIRICDGITIETGYPMAGGRGGMLDVVEIWINAWPVIKEFASHAIVAIGFLSSSISLVQWLKSIKGNEKNIPYPEHFFDYIYKRLKWNHRELAECLDISPEEARQWLKVLLYQWDNSIKAYVVSEDDKNKVMNMVGKVIRYSDE